MVRGIPRLPVALFFVGIFTVVLVGTLLAATGIYNLLKVLG